MKNPKVTVIMPVYNAGQYLEEGLETLVHQTLKEIEVICVDDGSKDDSLEILNRYAKDDHRIRILQQENQGAGIARNYGFQMATGQYVIFLDADDVYDVSMLEKAYNKGEKTRADVVVFAANYFSDEYDMRQADWMLDERVLGDAEEIETPNHYQDVFNYSGCNPWNKLIRKNFIEENDIRFQDIKRSNDVYFISMAMALSKKIAFVKEHLVNYRISATSLQGSNTGKNLEFFHALVYLQKELIKRGMMPLVEESFHKMALEHCVNILWNSERYEYFYSIHQRYKEMACALGIEKYVDENPRNQLQYKNYILLLDCADSVLTYEVVKAHRLLACMDMKKKWTVPYEKIAGYRNVLIYGAGSAGRDIYAELSNNTDYSIVGWVDQNYAAFCNSQYTVEPVESVGEKQFDCIIIAISDEKISAVVANNLKNNLKLENIPIIKI